MFPKTTRQAAPTTGQEARQTTKCTKRFPKHTGRCERQRLKRLQIVLAYSITPTQFSPTSIKTTNCSHLFNDSNSVFDSHVKCDPKVIIRLASRIGVQWHIIHTDEAKPSGEWHWVPALNFPYKFIGSQAWWHLNVYQKPTKWTISRQNSRQQPMLRHFVGRW